MRPSKMRYSLRVASFGIIKWLDGKVGLLRDVEHGLWFLFMVLPMNPLLFGPNKQHWIMFFVFSRGFNTVQSARLFEKLWKTQMDVSKTFWIIDHRTDSSLCNRRIEYLKGGQQLGAPQDALSSTFQLTLDLHILSLYSEIIKCIF